MLLDAIHDALSSEATASAFIDAIDRKIINYKFYEILIQYPVQRDDRWISEHAEEKKSISNFLLFCRDFLARDIDPFYVLSTTYHATSLIPVNFRLPDTFTPDCLARAIDPESIPSSGYRDRYRDARGKQRIRRSRLPMKRA